LEVYDPNGRLTFHRNKLLNHGCFQSLGHYDAVLQKSLLPGVKASYGWRQLPFGYFVAVNNYLDPGSAEDWYGWQLLLS
jgi:hypothetical protein